MARLADVYGRFTEGCRTRDLEDRTVHGWRTGGWNDDGRNTAMMLEILWARGEVMIVGRDGQQRVWDLAARRLPLHEPRPLGREVARRILDGQLRARGVAKPSQFGWALDGLRPPGWERVLSELVREGVAVSATVTGHVVPVARGEIGIPPFIG